MKSPVYAVVTQRMTESLNKLKQERSRKSSYLISFPLFKPILIIMVLKKVLLISGLLTCLVPEPAFSLMVDQHGVEVGEHFHFEDNDKRQHQTTVSPVDLQGTSDDRVLTKTVPKGSSSSIGVPLSYRDLKQTKEKPSQQSSQEINDKYFLSTFPSETMLTDLFSLHEQYFEIQEKEFLTSSTNVKGRLTENIGFWETIGANPEILKISHEGYRIPFFRISSRIFFQK